MLQENPLWLLICLLGSFMSCLAENKIMANGLYFLVHWEYMSVAFIMGGICFTLGNPVSVPGEGHLIYTEEGVCPVI